MDLQKQQYPGYTPTSSQTMAGTQTFVAGVFMRMFIALGITAASAYYFYTSGLYTNLFSSLTGKLNFLGWFVMLSPIGFVLAISAGVQRFSITVLSLLFFAYSVIMGISFSFILQVYTGSSIALTFIVTSATFGIMAFAGYTTKTDLSKFGAILMMALVGIIIAMLVNFFLKSSTMDYFISFIGVLIFTGLTAWDMQKIKRMGEYLEEGSEMTQKMAIMGALTLYLDFINLFLFLLRFLGRRN
jgi:uncharacterized protein